MSQEMTPAEYNEYYENMQRDAGNGIPPVQQYQTPEGENYQAQAATQPVTIQQQPEVKVFTATDLGDGYTEVSIPTIQVMNHETPSFMFSQDQWRFDKYVEHEYQNGNTAQVKWFDKVDFVVVAMIVTWTFLPTDRTKNSVVVSIKVNNDMAFKTRVDQSEGRMVSSTKLVCLANIKDETTKKFTWNLAILHTSGKGQTTNLKTMLQRISQTKLVPNNMKLKDVILPMASGKTKTIVKGAGGASSFFYGITIDETKVDTAPKEVAEIVTKSLDKITQYVNSMIQANTDIANNAE